MVNARCLVGVRQDVGPCHGAAKRKETKVRSFSITQQMSHISPRPYFQHAHFIPIVGVEKRGEY